MKNRTIIGIICMVLAVAITFLIAPVVNNLTSDTTSVVRLAKDIKQGSPITEADIEEVKVKTDTMPNGVIVKKNEVVGKFASSNLFAGDYFTKAKVSGEANTADDVFASLTVLFDNYSEVLHDRVKLSEIKPMTDEEYTVRGCTALIDALGGAIHHIGNIHKYARPADVPAHTMFIITTDGQENASHKYTSARVKHMIERQKSRYGWEFLFIGANIDAVETAARYGIDRDRAVNYNADGQGTQILYESVSKAVCNVRASAPLSADWCEEINADYQKRSKKSK